MEDDSLTLASSAGKRPAPTAGLVAPSAVGDLLVRWYAVGVMPGSEEKAECHLRRQGFEPFMPRQRRTIRHARKLIEKKVAFFPGYMFLPLDLSRARWRSVNGTFGVRSLIMQGERPVPCPHGLVERFVEMTGLDGLLDLSSRLDAGQSVRVVSGPLAELIGTIERLDGSGRARVLLKIMNGDISASMDVKDLVAA